MRKMRDASDSLIKKCFPSKWAMHLHDQHLAKVADNTYGPLLQKTRRPYDEKIAIRIEHNT